MTVWFKQLGLALGICGLLSACSSSTASETSTPTVVSKETLLQRTVGAFCERMSVCKGVNFDKAFPNGGVTECTDRSVARAAEKADGGASQGVYVDETFAQRCAEAIKKMDCETFMDDLSAKKLPAECDN